MANNPVVWFEIYVKEMRRAKKFYEDTLQIELKKFDAPAGDITEMCSFPSDMNGSGASGALVKMEGGPAGGGGTIVYFACKDCATEVGRVPSAGGKIMKEKFSIGQYGFIALGIDTEGNVFGLHSMK